MPFFVFSIAFLITGSSGPAVAGVSWMSASIEGRRADGIMRCIPDGARWGDEAGPSVWSRLPDGWLDPRTCRGRQTAERQLGCAALKVALETSGPGMRARNARAGWLRAHARTCDCPRLLACPESCFFFRVDVRLFLVAGTFEDNGYVYMDATAAHRIQLTNRIGPCKQLGSDRIGSNPIRWDGVV